MTLPGSARRDAATVDQHWLEKALATRPFRVLLFVALGTVAVIRVTQVLASVGGLVWAYDFSAYWFAAERLLQGEPIYWPEQLSGPFPPQVRFAYLYPPLLAVLLAPLPLLFDGYVSAMALWSVGGIALLAFSVIALARTYRLAPLAVVLLVLATVALPSVAAEAAAGNVHFLLLGLLTGAWLALARRTRYGELAGGGLIALATLIKVFPALIVLWLLLRRRYAAAVSTLLVGGILVVATLPVVGLQPWLEFPTALSNIGRAPALWSSIAPASFLAEFVDFGVARLVVATAGVAILAWSALRQAAPVSYGVAVMVSFLVVPTIYPHYLAMSVLPLTLLTLISRSWLLPTVTYVVLFIGSQAAPIDLEAPLVRVLVLAATLAPLVALLVSQRAASRRATSEPVPQAV